MKGYSFDIGPQMEETDPPGHLTAWEDRVADAIGAVIASWGFKHNQGRVWAVLFLRGVPFSAQDVGEELGLSKGAVSMILRELEGWGVVHRVRVRRARAWHFVAEHDFLQMIRNVVTKREGRLLEHVSRELTEAEGVARADTDASPEALARVSRLRAAAGLMNAALARFLDSGQIDLASAAAALTGGPPAPRPAPAALPEPHKE